jgi:hypothetical protein
MSDQKTQNFVYRERSAVDRFLTALEDLDNLANENAKLGYSGMTPEDLEESDLEGVDVQALKDVFASLAALGPWRDAGHETNFYKARP